MSSHWPGTASNGTKEEKIAANGPVKGCRMTDRLLLPLLPGKRRSPAPLWRRKFAWDSVAVGAGAS